MDTSFGKVRFFDDFLGDTINLDHFIVNADTGGTAAAIVEAENGTIALLSDGTDGDIQNIFGAEIWQPNVMGTIVFEARVKLVTSISQGLFIGLSDENDADEVPIDLDGGTLTTTAADAVGFVYDSGDTGEWVACSVKAGVDGTEDDTNTAPVVATWQTFRIVLESNGNALFFIDGKQVASKKACVTTTVQYCPAIAQLANGTAADVHVDYIFVEGGRS